MFFSFKFQFFYKILNISWLYLNIKVLFLENSGCSMMGVKSSHFGGVLNMNHHRESTSFVLDSSLAPLGQVVTVVRMRA